MISKRLVVFLFLLVVLKSYADDTLSLFSPNHNIQLTKLKLAPGGGTAISLVPASADEIIQVKKYK